MKKSSTFAADFAAYADDWKSGKTFTPFGKPMNTEQFCHMLADALRSGKNDINI